MARHRLERVRQPIGGAQGNPGPLLGTMRRPAPRSDRTAVTDHATHSVGGRGGHLVRRLIHLSMVVLPWAWYWHVADLEAASGWSRTTLALVLLGLLAVAEAGRLALGITAYGQRAYEARQVSAVAWGGLSVLLVLLLAPERGVQGAALGLPIVASLALVDPLLGELRRAGRSGWQVALAGVLGCGLVWAGSAAVLGTPWVLVAPLAVVTVAAEWPSLRWIDDNATMTLVPLALVLALDPLLTW